ncbi:MAG: prephenate dehydratase [Myxococcaceae bacterium]
MKIAFQGERGAYSEEAARTVHPDAEMVPCARFSDAFDAVASGKVNRGVLPVENSQAGTILETYDLLLTHALHIVGEIDFRVRHCLLALPGETLETLRTAHSHPQALAQTDAYLRAHRLSPCVEYDTAGSAKLIAEKQLAHAGAVASRVAADIYGLKVLAEGIETNPDNRTRFLILDRQPAPRSAPAKTSLAIFLNHQPGALFRALGAFAERGVNLTKLESRPNRLAAWEYVFYVDVEGHVEEPSLAQALEVLKRDALQVRVLGTYPLARV